MPNCPNCNEKMAIIWHCEPKEFIEEYVKAKKVFYGGLELANVDRDSPDRIIYHCYNCNRSYSKNLKRYVEESKVEYPYEEMENLVNDIADEVIDNLKDEIKEQLKLRPRYSHFEFGLYIRNNYIYNNNKIKYRIEPDELSYKIYNKILEKLSK